MNLSERITERRKQCGLSQEGLAQKLGVSRQAVSKWETGDAEPENGNLLLLAQTLGVSVDWLLSGEADIQGENVIPAVPVEQDTKQKGETVLRRIRWDRIGMLLLTLLFLFSLIVVRVWIWPQMMVSVEPYQLHNYYDPILLGTMLVVCLLVLGAGGQLPLLGKTFVWWFSKREPLPQPEKYRRALKAAWWSMAVAVGLRFVGDTIHLLVSMDLSFRGVSMTGMWCKMLLIECFYLLVAALLLLPPYLRLGRDQAEQCAM